MYVWIIWASVQWWRANKLWTRAHDSCRVELLHPNREFINLLLWARAIKALILLRYAWFHLNIGRRICANQESSQQDYFALHKTFCSCCRLAFSAGALDVAGNEDACQRNFSNESKFVHHRRRCSPKQKVMRPWICSNHRHYQITLLWSIPLLTAFPS